jgi:uncharacterized protein YecE (DUF72 family)
MAVMEPTSAATIRPTDEDELRTREGLDAIANEGRLGALLIQFPVSFKNTPLNREYIDRLVRQFMEYACVVEVRDSSWNNAETLAAFTHKNVSFCNIDQPLIGRSLAPTEHVTAPTAKTTYVITNNHFESKAGVNALQLKSMLSAKRVLAPPTLIQKYPELRNIADPAQDFGEDSSGSQMSLLA